MTVSIIIAVKENNPNLRECINACLELSEVDFEILVLPDKEASLTYPKTTIIPTGALTPPQKRDMAIGRAKGEIFAFLDDDAYPRKDWLVKAIAHFCDDEIAAVCGPAVTPVSDNLRQKASGLIFSSWLASGRYNYRYIPKKKRFVDDYPSCNFLIRKSVFEELGGFNTKFWPGEDTFLCLKIVKDLHKKILYSPEVLVFHHRRPLFTPHLRQVVSYALHRGYFVKRFPENSFKFGYFIPSFFVAGLILGALLSLFIAPLRMPYILALSLYLATVFIYSVSCGFALTLLVFRGIIFSHIAYGLYFVKGLFTLRLKEEE